MEGCYEDPEGITSIFENKLIPLNTKKKLEGLYGSVGFLIEELFHLSVYNDDFCGVRMLEQDCL
jgi:hypothetical protein